MVKTLAIAFSIAALGIAQVASAGAGAVCNDKTNISQDISGKDGSECRASSDGSSISHASAVGNSYAEAFTTTHGKANAVANGMSTAGAYSDNGGHSTAHATQGADAGALSGDGGTANATATGAGSEADVNALDHCKATSKATSGARAIADCLNPGEFVVSKATGGGMAEGSGNSLPTCTANGGTASVKSSGGNCHEP